VKAILWQPLLDISTPQTVAKEPLTHLHEPKGKLRLGVSVRAMLAPRWGNRREPDLVLSFSLSFERQTNHPQNRAQKEDVSPLWWPWDAIRHPCHRLNYPKSPAVLRGSN